MQNMDTVISATELARRVGDVLARIRYRGESFVVERNGTPVARIGPVPGSAPGTLREALAAWRGVALRDPSFADDIARVNAEDQPPADVWDS